MGAIKSIFLRSIFVFTLLHAVVRVLHTNKNSDKIFVGNSSLARIGKVKWSRQRIIEESKVFREVYGRRPVAISESGSNLFHAFAQWCIIRMVQPSLIVESGAMLGWGTWFLRQAAGTRDIHIVVISPQCPNDVAKGKKPFYMDTVNATYLCNNEFKDFAEVDWVDIGVVNDLVEFSTALVYFDDHQSGYRRLIEAQRVGFGHLLFDDGYPWPGDNYSLKQALDVEDDLYTYHDNFNSFRTWINHEEKECIYSDVRGRINVYFEFPPLWEGPWRNMVYRHMQAAREPGLLNSREANEFLNGFKLFKPDKVRESSAYTFISYVELRKQKFLGKACFGAHQNVPEQFIPK